VHKLQSIADISSETNYKWKCQCQRNILALFDLELSTPKSHASVRMPEHSKRVIIYKWMTIKQRGRLCVSYAHMLQRTNSCQCKTFRLYAQLCCNQNALWQFTSFCVKNAEGSNRQGLRAKLQSTFCPTPLSFDLSLTQSVHPTFLFPFKQPTETACYPCPILKTSLS